MNTNEITNTIANTITKTVYGTTDYYTTLKLVVPFVEPNVLKSINSTCKELNVSYKSLLFDIFDTHYLNIITPTLELYFSMCEDWDVINSDDDKSNQLDILTNKVMTTIGDKYISTPIEEIIFNRDLVFSSCYRSKVLKYATLSYDFIYSNWESLSEHEIILLLTHQEIPMNFIVNIWDDLSDSNKRIILQHQILTETFMGGIWLELNKINRYIMCKYQKYRRELYLFISSNM